MYKTEPHLHTAEISSCANIRASEMVRLHYEAGYNTIFITDHLSWSFCDSLGDIPWQEKTAIFLSGYYKAKVAAEKYDITVLMAAEVTFRTDAAEESIKILAENYPDMLVGAGTVLTTEQVDRAVNAGAKFIVSPGLNPKVVKYCVDKGIPVTPGCSNPSDVEVAIELGLDVVKFFPAEAAGGLNMIKSMAAPYTKMKFMPTGGVSPKNMKDYLSNPKIIACGGTWMIDKKAMQEKNFAKIEELTRQAVREMLEIKIKHIGINVPTAEAKGTAEMMARLFQGVVSETSKGYFGSPLIEVMNEGFHVGTHGHIAMGVSSTERAMAYFKALGYEFDEESVTYDAHGDAKFAYFKGEFAGFGVHLVNN